MHGFQGAQEGASTSDPLSVIGVCISLPPPPHPGLKVSCSCSVNMDSSCQFFSLVSMAMFQEDIFF